MGVFFIVSNNLLEARQKLRPVICEKLEGQSVSSDYQGLINMKSNSLINTMNIDGRRMNLTQLFHITYEDGCDTATSQRIWKSESVINVSDYLFQYGVVPFCLEPRPVVF